MDDSDYLSYKSLSDDDDEEMFGEEEAEWINDMRQVVTNAVRKSQSDENATAPSDENALPEPPKDMPDKREMGFDFYKRKRRKRN